MSSRIPTHLRWALLAVFLAPSRTQALEWQVARDGMAGMHAGAASSSLYVLAGGYGTVWTSPDGAAWTRAVTPNVSEGINGATFAGGQFVLVGEARCCGSNSGALVMTSPDGIAWTLVSGVPVATLNAVAFGVGKYVAVGNQGAILTSSDGASWTTSTVGNQNLKGVAFGGGAFVAVGDNATVLRSTNGTSWSPAVSVPVTSGLSYEDVTHTGTQFVLVGNQSTILTSPDGDNWTNRSLAFPNNNSSLGVVLSGGGTIVAGDSERVWSSLDGSAWTQRSLSWSNGEPNPEINVLAYNNASKFVAAGTRVSNGEVGTLHSSPDGITWTKRTLTENRHLNAVAWGNNTFCAVGYSGSVASSPDGITWTNRIGIAVTANTDNVYSWNNILFSAANNVFVATGGGPGGVMTSPDCINWTNHSVGGNRAFWGLAEGPGILVTVGGLGVGPGTGPMDRPSIATSINGGVNWTSRDPVSIAGTGTFAAIAFRPETTPGAGDALFVAAGGYSPSGALILYTSPDGITWTARTATGLGSYQYFSDMTYANGTFVLLSGANVWTSTDGVAWTARGGSLSAYTALFADGGFVAVGSNGKNGISTDALTWVSFDAATRQTQNRIAYSPTLDRLVATGQSALTYAASVPPPTLSINDVSINEGQTGSSSAPFTVTLSAATTNTVSVQFTTIDGTATAGSDYNFAFSTVTFTPGQTSRPVSVSVTGDTTSESNEAFGVKLTALSGATVARGLGQGTIVNDDGTASGVPTRPQPSWQEFFAVDTLETPYVGDFNGDGKTDIITFARQNPAAFGDVYAALSQGVKFGANNKWHDFFAIDTSEQVVIGDYDGDGKADIGTWLATTSRQFYVALSQGSGMGTASVWASSIGTSPTDLIFAGDANGDGKKDLIVFARTEGKVYVALSNGTTFGTPTVWHNFFAVSTYERPRVADVNGDGRADIVTFATDSPTAFGDVYVAVSNGTKFVSPLSGAVDSSDKWHDFFAIRPTEEVRIGDLNGDGKDDFFTFLPPPFAQCYTVFSQGTYMTDSVLWGQAVAPLLGQGDNVYVGDVNGDGKADIVIFAQKEGKTYVAIAP
jgi:hypothetical protein